MMIPTYGTDYRVLGWDLFWFEIDIKTEIEIEIDIEMKWNEISSAESSIRGLNLRQRFYVTVRVVCIIVKFCMITNLR